MENGLLEAAALTWRWKIPTVLKILSLQYPSLKVTLQHKSEHLVHIDALVQNFLTWLLLLNYFSSPEHLLESGCCFNYYSYNFLPSLQSKIKTR